MFKLKHFFFIFIRDREIRQQVVGLSLQKKKKGKKKCLKTTPAKADGSNMNGPQAADR